MKINFTKYLMCCIFICSATFAQSIPKITLDKFRNAMASADVVSIENETTVSITNGTMSANQSELDGIVGYYFGAPEGRKLLTENQLNEILNAYTNSAREFCKKRSLYPNYGEVVGENTKRFRCLTPVQFAVQKAKADLSLCEGMHNTNLKYSKNSKFDDVINSASGFQCGGEDKPTQNYCDEYQKILKNVSKPSCGYIKKNFETYLLNISTANSSATQNQNQKQIDAAKLKCLDLGFVAETEKFGECVLRVYR